MSSIKVLLRTSNKLKNGEHPIVLRIIKERKTKFIFTGLTCAENFWDFKKNRPVSKHPNAKELNIFITKKIYETQKVILNLENDEKDYSSEEIKKKYKASKKQTTVFSFFDEIITTLTKSNKIGNAKIYKDCKRMLFKFREEQDLSFSDIDVSFLKRFERSFLERDVSGNSISVYMRTIRAVFNKAIAEGYCKKENYPFNDYKVIKLNTETAKRALSKDQMQSILSLNLDISPSLQFAKNIFLFSYYNRGINFKDIALLKWNNIKEGRLEYRRAKTGKLYSIKLLDPSIYILDQFKLISEYDSESYIFPLLNKEIHISPVQIDNRIKKTAKTTNKGLKEIALRAKIDFNLTTYVARHSYATIMKRNGVSTSLISESLGHRSEKTTQVYLDSFENKMLDEANKAIL
jgi:site-specific recombinase XerD